MTHNNIALDGRPHRGWLVMLTDIFISLFGSFLAILMVRWMIHPIRGFQLYVAEWLAASLVVSLLAFAAFGTYRMVMRHSDMKSLVRLVLASAFKVIVMGLALLVQLFHFKDFRTEVLILTFDFLFTVFLLILVRMMLIIVIDDMRNNVGTNVEKMRVAIYGSSDQSVAAFMRLVASDSYNVVGFLQGGTGGGQLIHGKKVYRFDNDDDLVRLRQQLGIDGVVIPVVDGAHEERKALAGMFVDNGISVVSIKETPTASGSDIRIRAVMRPTEGNDFIPDGMTSFERNFKRIIDCALAGVLLVVFSPLFLVCWIAVRREDHGPAIYSQERIGRFGRPFNIYKFRSMRLDAEAMGPALFSGDDDPRLTRVGKFLRLHHLDELPQLWNVFCGDMAFIGYRPERQFYIDQIIAADPRYSYLYQIRPGVTSYATLYNGYTDTLEKMLRRLEYDLYYLRNRSMWFDMKILWLTFQSIAFGKKF